jgi:hypothetical protein
MTKSYSLREDSVGRADSYLNRQTSQGGILRDNGDNVRIGLGVIKDLDDEAFPWLRITSSVGEKQTPLCQAK